ncbi:hypothetical protein BDV59DRAFT_211419 [Aspergillus ambiguus]|uniref:uncharacterized protein n=1 Tax=Aspergillus ambiguus TaxID=176160 RepID=UPI003CCD9CFF
MPQKTELPQSPSEADAYTPTYRTNTTGSIETRYVQMLVELDCMPWYYNLLAGLGHWLLLAGYLVIPGTFTSLQKSKALEDRLYDSEAGKTVLHTIQNPPLVGIAVGLLVLGSLLLGWAFWENRSNYIWLIDRVFMPTFLNGVAGLMTCIVNVYTARDGDWSIMALLTIITTGLAVSVFMGLLVIYKFGKLVKVKQEHELERNACFYRVTP